MYWLLRLLRLKLGFQFIYIKHTVEVVAFVLEDDGGEILNPFCSVLQGRSGVPYFNIAIPHHIAAAAGDGKAAFGAGAEVAVGGHYTNIRINLERLAGLVEALDRYNSTRYSYLWSGYAHSVFGGILYGGQHKCGKCLKFRRLQH